MASGDAGLDPDGDVRRSDDACADWRAAGIEPSSRSRVQFGPQASSLGKAEAEEG